VEKFGPGSEVQISQLPTSTLPAGYVATDADEKVLRRWSRRSATTTSSSTDYPHSDGSSPRDRGVVALEGVSDKTKAKILWDNCARLYR